MKVVHDNKTYSQSEWYSILSNFIEFSEDRIILRKNMPNLTLAYIKDVYVDNVSKSTFSGVILPCIVFSLLSLINTLIIVTKGNELNNNILVFMIFIAIVYLIFAFIFLIKTIKREKLIYRNTRYNYLSNDEFQKRLRIFKMHQYIYFKPLITKRLMIREFTSDDCFDYFAFASSEKVCKYLNVDIITSIDNAQNSLNRIINEYENKQIFKLAIMLKETHKVIGYIGLSRFDLSKDTCQVVYAIHEDYWHQGYVSEALGAFVTYLKDIGKKLIIAGHVKENEASGKVLLKNGFVRDSSRDYQMMIHGELKDIISYSIDERKNV